MASPLKRVRRAVRKVRRRLASSIQAGRSKVRSIIGATLHPISPAARVYREEARKVRLMRDLASLREYLAGRPELRLAITSAGRVDGAGGQVLAVVSAMAFAHNHHCRYLHTPFRHIDHVEGDAAAWTRRWETFFGLGHGEPLVPADSQMVPLERFAPRIRRSPTGAIDPGLVVHALSFHYAEMAKPATLRHLMPILRAKYLSTDKSAIPVFRTAGAVNVAVHVRRGDVGPDDPRYTTDLPILATIAGVSDVINSVGRRTAIHLFSEGTPDRFQPYSALGCTLHLSTDPFEAFHNLVASDLLITTDSAFGRSAAMMSDAIALHPTSKWGLAERWLTYAADGTFDRAKLATLLMTSR